MPYNGMGLIIDLQVHLLEYWLKLYYMRNVQVLKILSNEQKLSYKNDKNNRKVPES